MNKLFTKILLGVFAVFLFAGVSHAATSVRLEQPGTPTNRDTFTITFVALDTNNSSISVQCFKKGPSDGSFVAFNSPIALSNGGNTDNCQVTSGVMNQGNGTYQFKVEATAEETVTSNTVSVEFNNQAPGTPVNYNKTKPDNCTYKIEFRTANDSGKTVKVVLYRSSNTTFSLDGGTQVNSVNIGSDTDGSMTDNVSPNCSTEYFYVIRAFDVYGNGSGVVGDNNVTVTTLEGTTASTGTTGQGAIALGQGGGQVLGDETKAGEVKGDATDSATTDESEMVNLSENPVSNLTNWVLTHKKISLLVLLVLGALAYYLFRRYKK